VIPYGDKAYPAARGELAYTGEQVLRLDDRMGLNPKLANFKKQFDAGRLAIVRNVGYPKPDRSHFRSMDIWQTGQPARPGNSGWLGRWLDTVKDGDPRLAVTFERVLPPVLAGTTRAGAGDQHRRNDAAGGIPAVAALRAGPAVEGEPPMQARAARAFADLVHRRPDGQGPARGEGRPRRRTGRHGRPAGGPGSRPSSR
jgi:uncharacterized protein (DUF1501 family)